MSNAQLCCSQLACIGILMFASTAMLQLDNDLPSLTFPGKPLPQTQVDTLPQVTQIDQIEELQAYHSQIDKLNDMINPDPINHLW